ncbi:hypothetical protein [Burkholderia ubonensis]|uniref:hypothetical protein n=1 Tax=Burkholderia ubonensis TaxID=101571 RepID=UPI00075B5E7C|nr:hypothetical protein [Burkholderia ubonensis]KUZ76904.1 hypothetical protein WI37_16120 [Burkholderia ubonensis]
MKRDLHLASAIGPATREQLEQWAIEHDRIWDRRVSAGRVFLVGCSIGFVGLGAAALKFGFSGFGMWEGRVFGMQGIVLGFLVASACPLAILGMWSLYRRRLDLRPANPYRAIDYRRATLAGLEESYANFPGALAYLDAIRHQGRPIVPHDLDVLAMALKQNQFNQGA